MNTAISKARLKVLALDVIERTRGDYPSEYMLDADGRRYRVAAIEWNDERGIVPVIEREEEPCTPV